jgi:hypothetical protein
MKASVIACPVPLEQQPLEEFRLLQESSFFRWAMLESRPYAMSIVWVWVWSWLVAGPVAAASFPPSKHLTQFLLVGSAGAVFILCLVLSRLYLGWIYIRGRLLSQTVFYEESGWYDGQTWVKPPEIIDRDRLIVSYEIKPILQRLHRTFAVLAVILLGEAGFWAFR